MNSKELLEEILAAFNFEGEFYKKKLLNVGNINDTFAVKFLTEDGSNKYIVQRINNNVFTEPEKLMDNMGRVTSHIADKIREEGGNVLRETLSLVKTKDGKNFYRTSNGDYYRAFPFIRNARTYMKVENDKHIYEAGKALGKFQKQLSDFNAEDLFEVIEDFHNTPKRFDVFVEAIENDAADRVKLAKQEIDFILNRKAELNKLMDLYNEGSLPLRVTHNDTKFNNIMIDDETGKAICVIDLDTVMPGLSLYDFGDAIRSGCSTAEEDETDLSKVSIDLNLYEKFVQGVLEETSDTLTIDEINNIAFSAKLITMELAMRFLTDYLNGDKYFKVNSDTHNLERTRNQLKLAYDMEKKMPVMEAIIERNLEIAKAV
ncbi:MAG: phosphotransferase enzyme family protein [Sarcina sp.]